jgi:hypothetical protein
MTERVVREMGVSVSRAGLGMAEQPANDMERHSARYQMRCKRMPKIMNPRIGQTGRLPNRRPGFFDLDEGFVGASTRKQELGFAKSDSQRAEKLNGRSA